VDGIYVQRAGKGDENQNAQQNIRTSIFSLGAAAKNIGNYLPCDEKGESKWIGRYTLFNPFSGG
jgi:hypothetical protein